MSVEDTVRCVLVSSDRELAASVAELVSRMPGAELVATLTAARALARPPACDVLLIGDQPSESPAGLATELTAACPSAGVVLLRRDPDLQTYREAMAAGVRAVVSVPPAPAELVEAIGEVSRGVPSVEVSSRGALLAVAGAVGGVGTTALALALARLGGGTLVDLGHGWSRVGHAREPAASVVDLARVGTAMGIALDSVTVEAVPGQPVIAAPADPELLELLPPGFGATLAREARARWPLTLVDAGRATCAAGRELAASADMLLVVTSPDPRAAAATRALITSAAAWGVDADRTAVVVNRMRGGSELSSGGVERAAGCRVAAVVRERRRAMRAYAAGEDLAGWPARTPFAKLRGLIAEAVGER